ncbi:peptidase M23 [Brevibacillus reuszeri]|uniref:Metalloendopeptidase n=1 Tax=Brevibacillus reuszeri TaxID=54915 RepID=A0A0K9YKS4_9BACL|nr:M23 family metallopeptidase [Brevibacillus reuszeri]KNB69262.1 metalloendopeptidase [Brevibacillus reuszeri]MED1860207.1 M23 family metallopeptidase [Brevibacillus reuszeri]GED71594.1 peptidase M23 [Brevibacillus reuszeri]
MKKTWMIMSAFTLLLAGCWNNYEQKSVTTTSTGSTATPGATTDKLKSAEIGQALLSGEFERVYEQTSTDFKKELSKAQFGDVVKNSQASIKSWNPNSKLTLNGSSYETWVDQDGKFGLIAMMNEQAEISGLRFTPLESFTEQDKALTKLTYRAPFKGEWYVFWGGQNVLANYHYAVPSQRYAYDLIQVKDGFSYKGDAKKNESYYMFGQEILAPEAGTVVHIVNDVKDNVPVGVMNEAHPAGNVVVIDHGNGEYSYLAHLKEGSVTVKVGDRVAKGDTIGLGGNSGNSSEPHLHYQVSDGKDLFTSKSIRVQWENNLNPIQGETVTGN